MSLVPTMGTSMRELVLSYKFLISLAINLSIRPSPCFVRFFVSLVIPVQSYPLGFEPTSSSNWDKRAFWQQIEESNP